MQKGLLRELNPGPLAPEARIIPLDQAADACIQGVVVTADRGGFRAAGHSQLRGLAMAGHRWVVVCGLHVRIGALKLGIKIRH